MDGVHVTVSIVAAHILGPRILGTWGRSELYPPLFGRLRDLGPISLKGELRAAMREFAGDNRSRSHMLTANVCQRSGGDCGMIC